MCSCKRVYSKLLQTILDVICYQRSMYVVLTVMICSPPGALYLKTIQWSCLDSKHWVWDLPPQRWQQLLQNLPFRQIWSFISAESESAFMKVATRVYSWSLHNEYTILGVKRKLKNLVLNSGIDLHPLYTTFSILNSINYCLLLKCTGPSWPPEW